MAFPLPQVDQQMADGSGFRAAVGPLQGAQQGSRQGTVAVAGCPTLQQGQIPEHQRIQPLCWQGLAGAEQTLPGRLPLVLQLLTPAGLPQGLDLDQTSGFSPLLTPTEPALITLQPLPEGRPQEHALALAQKIGQRIELRTLGPSGLVPEEQPGHGKLPPAWEVALQALGRKLGQHFTDTRRLVGGDPIEIAQR